MLPERTKLAKPRIISKKRLLQQGKWTTQEREQLTQQIKSLSLTHQLDEKTLRIPSGETIKQIVVLKIELKETDYSLSLINKIAQLYSTNILVQIYDSHQNTIWILPYSNQNIRECYVSTKNLSLEIQGNSMDEVYLQLIHQIHPLFLIDTTDTIDALIQRNKEIEVLKKQLHAKKKKMYTEKSIKKQMEYKKEYIKLQKQLKGLGYHESK